MSDSRIGDNRSKLPTQNQFTSPSTTVPTNNSNSLNQPQFFNMQTNSTTNNHPAGLKFTPPPFPPPPPPPPLPPPPFSSHNRNSFYTNSTQSTNLPYNPPFKSSSTYAPTPQHHPHNPSNYSNNKHATPSSANVGSRGCRAGEYYISDNNYNNFHNYNVNNNYYNGSHSNTHNNTNNRTNYYNNSSNNPYTKPPPHHPPMQPTPPLRPISNFLSGGTTPKPRTSSLPPRSPPPPPPPSQVQIKPVNNGIDGSRSGSVSTPLSFHSQSSPITNPNNNNYINPNNITTTPSNSNVNPNNIKSVTKSALISNPNNFINPNSVHMINPNNKPSPHTSKAFTHSHLNTPFNSNSHSRSNANTSVNANTTRKQTARAPINFDSGTYAFLKASTSASAPATSSTASSSSTTSSPDATKSNGNVNASANAKESGSGSITSVTDSENVEKTAKEIKRERALQALRDMFNSKSNAKSESKSKVKSKGENDDNNDEGDDDDEGDNVRGEECRSSSDDDSDDDPDAHASDDENESEGWEQQRTSDTPEESDNDDYRDVFESDSPESEADAEVEAEAGIVEVTIPTVEEKEPKKATLNKPKPKRAGTIVDEAPVVVVAPKKRGRPFGSKNQASASVVAPSLASNVSVNASVNGNAKSKRLKVQHTSTSTDSGDVKVSRAQAQVMPAPAPAPVPVNASELASYSQRFIDDGDDSNPHKLPPTSTFSSSTSKKTRRTSKLPPPQAWVRRSVREVGLSTLHSPILLSLLQSLISPTCPIKVLKLKRYLGPDTISIVIDAVLEALMINTSVQALYIQNFNNGLRDVQMIKLTEVLKERNIWCLNVGETYNISNGVWARFTEGLKDTHITHMYASEHTISPSIKEAIRTNIRMNRAKHQLHCSEDNIDVILMCTHCWWNPINARGLREVVKRRSLEGVLGSGDGSGIDGDASGASGSAAASAAASGVSVSGGGEEKEGCISGRCDINNNNTGRRGMRGGVGVVK